MASPQQQLERYRHMLPIDLNKEFHDIVFIHPNDSDEDMLRARAYVNYISDGIRLNNGEDPKIVLFDDFAPEINSKVGRIAQAIERCSLKLIYITDKFQSDSEAEQSFFTETALAETLANPKTRNTIVPIYSPSVQTPTMFQCVAGIHMESQHELQKLGRLIDKTISVRKELEASQEQSQLTWAVAYHEQHKQS